MSTYLFQFYVLIGGMTIANAVAESSDQLQVSKGMLTSIVQEFGAHGNLKTGKARRKTKDFVEKMSPFQMQLIRTIVHEEFKKCNDRRKNKDADGGDLFPTVKSILKIINDKFSDQFPSMTHHKLWICLHRLGFKYKQHHQTKNVLLIGM